MARPGPEPSSQIRAFELLSEGRSLSEARELLAKEGITVGSLETVRRWALIGAKAASWVEEDAKSQDYTGPDFIRRKYATFLDTLIARGFDEMDKGKALYKDIAPIIGRFGREQTLALGGYAAARGELTVTSSAGELDPAVKAVVEEFQRRAAERDQQLLSGDEDS